MVTVMRGGEEVKISKRAGGYVTLRDLIDWSGATLESGRDAVRFFLISRKADAEFAFDIDLARSQSEENPVYYVQYAHARICSVLAQRNPGPITDHGADSAVDVATDLVPDLTCLSTPVEIALMARLAAWPDTVRSAVDELAPHLLAYYLRDLSADFHSFYNAQRVLVDDAGLRAARLALLAATQQVLRNGLALMGVSAPQRM
jgi:arginyl-tRNA synthetase